MSVKLLAYYFTHDAGNHAKNFINFENPRFHTQNMQKMWSVIKRVIKRKEKHYKPEFKNYLLEMIFGQLTEEF